MLPPEVEARVAAIAADRMAGASELGLRALEAFESFCTAKRTPRDLRELAGMLSAAQPSMAAVRNVAHLCARLIADSGDPVLALRVVRGVLEGAHDKIARNAIKVFPTAVRLFTLSRSAAVIATCRWLWGRGRLSAVTVMESGPGLEGRRTAQELGAAGIPATTVEDARGPTLVGECDAVLTGADSILGDGALVNKIGTHAVAIAANAARKPVHVACEVIKIDSANTASTFRMEWLGVLFDLTPRDLVTSFITDRGVFEPSSIATLVTP